jgi:Protein of unknown function (DUF3638)
MGSGKTTVVAPLLALFLADGTSLVVQAVPPALLEFTRATLRERFSSPIMRKPVITLAFDRFAAFDDACARRLQVAATRRAVVITTPSSIKALQLKFVEILHILDVARTDPKYLAAMQSGTLIAQAKIPRLRAQADVCAQVLQLFKRGVLLIDEVDLVLHPLRSELNFPIGNKGALDLTQNSKKGLRWEIPFFLLDPVSQN